MGNGEGLRSISIIAHTQLNFEAKFFKIPLQRSLVDVDEGTNCKWFQPASGTRLEGGLVSVGCLESFETQ